MDLHSLLEGCKTKAYVLVRSQNDVLMSTTTDFSLNNKKNQIQPEYGNDEKAHARRHGRTRLARPNSQARTGTDTVSPV